MATAAAAAAIDEREEGEGMEERVKEGAEDGGKDRGELAGEQTYSGVNGYTSAEGDSINMSHLHERMLMMEAMNGFSRQNSLSEQTSVSHSYSSLGVLLSSCSDNIARCVEV